MMVSTLGVPLLSWVMKGYKGVRNGAIYVASLHGGERQNQRLFYTFLFFYVLLDTRGSLSDSWTTWNRSTICSSLVTTISYFSPIHVKIAGQTENALRPLPITTPRPCAQCKLPQPWQVKRHEPTTTPQRIGLHMAKRQTTNGLLMQATNNIIVLNDILQHINVVIQTLVFMLLICQLIACIIAVKFTLSYGRVLLHYFNENEQGYKHCCELNFVVFFRLNAASPYI